MKNKLLKRLQEETNLTYNVKKGVLYGTYKDYYTYVQAFQTNIIVSLPINLNEIYTINEINVFLTKLTKDYSNIKSASYNNNSVQIHYEYKTVWKSNSDNILAILNSLIQEASINSLLPCCPLCGNSTDISPFLINNIFVPCCENCKLQTKNEIHNTQQDLKQVKSNVITGIVGAFLGSLIGVALWIVVGLLGYIAAISGLVLAICTIKGYQLFGGKLNKMGMIITIIITLVMVYVSQYLSLGLEIFNEFKVDYDLTIFDAIKSVPEFLKDSEVSRTFYGNLALGYLFTVIGSVSQFKNSYSTANYKVKTEEF